MLQNPWLARNGKGTRGIAPTLQRDGVLLDGSNGIVGNDSLAVLEDGGDVDLLPLNGNL